MNDEMRRKLRPLYRPLKLVLAAGAVLGYFYVVHLALDLKAKIDADEPSGEWIVQNKNEVRPRYTGPQTADALLSTMRFDLGEEKSEAQTAELKAHFERVLERGAVFEDHLDMLHFGPSLMRRFKQAAEYERLRVEERPDDADYPSIRALYELPESASWADLENALMDDDLKKWPDVRKQLDRMVDFGIKVEKKSTRGTLRETLWTTLLIAVVFLALRSWGFSRPFVRRAKSNDRGIRLLRDKGNANLAVLFLLIWCAAGSSVFMLTGPELAHSWLDDYQNTKTILRETLEYEQTAQKLLYKVRTYNGIVGSDFDNLATTAEVARQKGNKIADNILAAAAIFLICFGVLAWVSSRRGRESYSSFPRSSPSDAANERIEADA